MRMRIIIFPRDEHTINTFQASNGLPGCERELAATLINVIQDLITAHKCYRTRFSVKKEVCISMSRAMSLNVCP